MSKPSPTQRTLKEMRDRGYTCQVVEYWNPFARRRIDLFGCIDVVCLSEAHNGVLGIQTTSRANHSARRHKIAESEDMRLWVACGNTLLIQSWGKLKRGWSLREEEITLDMFTCG